MSRVKIIKCYAPGIPTNSKEQQLVAERKVNICLSSRRKHNGDRRNTLSILRIDIVFPTQQLGEYGFSFGTN